MPIYVNQPISHGGELPHTMPTPLCPPHPRVLSLGNYHICNSRVYKIMQAIRAARIGDSNLMILTDIRIINQEYCRNIMGYVIFSPKGITTAGRDSQGLLGMIVWEQPQVWTIK